MNGTLRRKAAVASTMLALGAVGSVVFGGTAFADPHEREHGPREREHSQHDREDGTTRSHGTAQSQGGNAQSRGSNAQPGAARASCVGPPLAVGVAVVGQNSSNDTQCSAKTVPPPTEGNAESNADGGDGS